MPNVPSAAIVPLDMIAAPVSPIDTPMAVTMPGHTRHSSMIGIIEKATSCHRDGSPDADWSSLRSPPRRLPRPPVRGRSAWRRNPVPWHPCRRSLNSLRSRSYGGMSPNSSSSRCGRISLSTKSRTAWRTISCSSVHLIIWSSCSCGHGSTGRVNLTARSS